MYLGQCGDHGSSIIPQTSICIHYFTNSKSQWRGYHFCIHHQHSFSEHYHRDSAVIIRILFCVHRVGERCTLDNVASMEPQLQSALSRFHWIKVPMERMLPFRLHSQHPLSEECVPYFRVAESLALAIAPVGYVARKSTKKFLHEWKCHPNYRFVRIFKSALNHGNAIFQIFWNQKVWLVWCAFFCNCWLCSVPACEMYPRRLFLCRTVKLVCVPVGNNCQGLSHLAQNSLKECQQCGSNWSTGHVFVGHPDNSPHFGTATAESIFKLQPTGLLSFSPLSTDCQTTLLSEFFREPPTSSPSVLAHWTFFGLDFTGFIFRLWFACLQAILLRISRSKMPQLIYLSVLMTERLKGSFIHSFGKTSESFMQETRRTLIEGVQST